MGPSRRGDRAARAASSPVAASASSTSLCVSARCVWIGRSSWRAYISTLRHVVVADGVGRVRRQREREPRRVPERVARGEALARYTRRRRRRTASGKSSTGMPTSARMPASARTRAPTRRDRSTCRCTHVMPPLSISAAPSIVPSCTNSARHEAPFARPDVLGEPWLERTSSAMPRSSVIAACVCALTRPGISTCDGKRRRASRGSNAPCTRRRRDAARRSARRRRRARGRSSVPAGSTGTIHLRVDDEVDSARRIHRTV